MVPIRLEPGARQDIREVYRHYKTIQPPLGERFLVCLRAAFALIQVHPEAFPARELGIRWLVLCQFPFKVFYVIAFDSVRVVALMHSHAHPDAWKKKLGVTQVDDE
jgi:plasmid stabilization system protein ParE